MPFSFQKQWLCKVDYGHFALSFFLFSIWMSPPAQWFSFVVGSEVHESHRRLLMSAKKLLPRWSKILENAQRAVYDVSRGPQTLQHSFVHDPCTTHIRHIDSCAPPPPFKIRHDVDNRVTRTSRNRLLTYEFSFHTSRTFLETLVSAQTPYR